MSNKVITKPTKESGLYKVGYKHEDGGIAVTVDNTTKVEVEIKEYKICNSFWNNDKVFQFKQKTNLEILDVLFQENNCVFETQSADSGDFILCRLVVLDNKLYDRSGTCKEIINEMQSEKSCNVTSDAKEDYGQKKQGGGLGNFENSDKSDKFTNKIIKDEINNIISGKSKVRYGDSIQAASLYLRGIEKPNSISEDPKYFKTQEANSLKSYALSNNLWLSESDYENLAGGGSEQDVYFLDKKTVVKTNYAIYYDSWLDYLNNLLIHNYFFPDTAYKLVGFMDKNGFLVSVVSQPLVSTKEKVDLEKVKTFLLDKGFINTENDDYYNPDLEIILQDLHDENVLTKNGTLFFIDTVFYLKRKGEFHLKDGGVITAKEEAQVRLDVLKRMQKKKPSKELALKIRNLASDIRKGNYTSGIVKKEEAPEVYTPELIATHNLDYGNLLFADKLGGISMPSLAIVRIQNPLMNFGDIILVAPQSFVDPDKNSSAHVFNRDIYSPTYPRIYSHIDKSALNKLESGFYEKKKDWSIYADEATRYDLSKFIEDLSNGKQLTDILDNVTYNSFIVYLWAKENGVEIEIPTERYNFIYWKYNPDTDHEFLNLLQSKYPVLWNAVMKDVYDFSNEELNKQLSDAFRDNYRIYNIEKEEDKDFAKVKEELLEDYFEDGHLKRIHDYGAFKNLVLAVTDKRRIDSTTWRETIEKVSNEHSHDIREFTKSLIDKIIWGNYFFRTKSSKMEVSLDNIYDYMGSKSIKSSQDTLVYGLGKSASVSAKEYDSLKAVARDKDHYTVSDKEFEEYKKKQDALWDVVTSKIRPYYKYENGFDALDMLSKAMGQISKFKNPTDEKISTILSKNDYGKTPSYLYDVARDFAECLRTAPAQYFEVKMTSIVKIESFIGAAVPKELAEDVVPILNKHGITNVSLYDKKDYENKQSNVSDALQEIVKKSEQPILFKNGGCLCENNVNG